MRATDLRRVRALAVLAAAGALALSLAGAAPTKKKKAEAPPPRVDETVGDLAYIVRNTDMKLEGVGLVVGLDNTGVDPPPSMYRNKLIEEMRKAQVENSNGILKDPKVSMVIVRVNVPAGVSPSDRLDAEIELPPNCGTSSLAGGYLLQCRLREVLVLGGSMKEGNDAAFAQGPVFTGSLAEPTKLKVGRILGGVRVRKEVPFQLILKESRKSFRTSSILEGVVNSRFPQTEGVNQKGSATAKTDQYLVLKMPRVYHQNQERFFRVVTLLPMVDGPLVRMQRTAIWRQQLLDPATAGVAALRLEGLGVTAADALKDGLASPNSQVKFMAAEALAFLGDASGADVLTESIRTKPEFRAYGLAALAAMDQEVASIKLRKLLDEPNIEVRYGAFNALRTIGDDAFLGHVRVLDEPKVDPEEAQEGDSMAVAIARTSRSRRRDDPFALYLVDCEGPPMVHVSRTRRCEVVLFGRGQRLQTPVVLGGGQILLNASDGDESVEISKIVPSKFTDSDLKVRSPLELGDVIRRVANIGAGYPQIVTILQAAEKQKNLPGPLVIDAVPGSSPVYLEAILGKDTTAKKDDAIQKTGAETKAKRPGLRATIKNRLGRNIGVKPDGTRVETKADGTKAETKP